MSLQQSDEKSLNFKIDPLNHCIFRIICHRLLKIAVLSGNFRYYNILENHGCLLKYNCECNA